MHVVRPVSCESILWRSPCTTVNQWHMLGGGFKLQAPPPPFSEIFTKYIWQKDCRPPSQSCLTSLGTNSWIHQCYEMISCEHCTTGIRFPNPLLTLIPNMKPIHFLSPTNAQINVVQSSEINSLCKKSLAALCFNFQCFQEAIHFSNLVCRCTLVLSSFLWTLCFYHLQALNRIKREGCILKNAHCNSPRHTSLFACILFSGMLKLLEALFITWDIWAA